MTIVFAKAAHYSWENTGVDQVDKRRNPITRGTKKSGDIVASVRNSVSADGDRVRLNCVFIEVWEMTEDQVAKKESGGKERHKVLLPSLRT